MAEQKSHQTVGSAMLGKKPDKTDSTSEPPSQRPSALLSQKVYLYGYINVLSVTTGSISRVLLDHLSVTNGSVCTVLLNHLSVTVEAALLNHSCSVVSPTHHSLLFLVCYFPPFSSPLQLSNLYSPTSAGRVVDVVYLEGTLSFITMLHTNLL